MTCYAKTLGINAVCYILGHARVLQRDSQTTVALTCPALASSSPGHPLAHILGLWGWKDVEAQGVVTLKTSCYRYFGC